MKEFILAFIPIFIAVDAIGIIPIFVNLTNDIDVQSRRRAIRDSIITATALGVAFIFLGKGLFRLLGVNMNDFLVAGGALLFLIAVLDLISGGRKPAREIGSIGVVPLGTPLLVGPAVLTTALMMVDIHGLLITLLALIVNIIVAGVILFCAGVLARLLGQNGINAISKVISILLAAIAVMMVRKGVIGIIAAAAGAGGA